MALHYYLGRQPIFNAATQVVAYELLYRTGTAAPEGFNLDQATSIVLLDLFELGLGEVVGTYPAYINVTKKIIVDHVLPTRGIHNVVLELQKDIDTNSQVIASIKKVKSLGYMIALDDFIYQNDLEPLYQLADIVKLDIQAHTFVELEREIAILKNYPVKSTALRVETIEQLHHCIALGFDYFQGFFFSQPQVIEKARLSQNRLVSLRLLQELNNPKTTIRTIEETLKIDVTLSYKLLRYINSSAFGLRHEINSIKHSIVLLGLDEIKRWASLIVLADISDKPDALTNLSLIRARMCELLVRVGGSGDPEIGFLVGLFSALDSMLDTPLEELFKQFPISKDVKIALLEKKGIYADYMDSILAYEKADWRRFNSKPNTTATSIGKIYRQSVQWADDKVKKLTSRLR